MEPCARPCVAARSASNGNGNGARAPDASVEVYFNLSKFPQVEESERLLLVGETSKLGSWNARDGLSFAPRETGWTAKAKFRPGERIEFKCVVSGPHGERWEGGDNRRLVVPSPLGRPLAVNLLWEGEAYGASSRPAANPFYRDGDEPNVAEESELDASLNKLKSTLDLIQDNFEGGEGEERGDAESTPAAPEDPQVFAQEEEPGVVVENESPAGFADFDSSLGLAPTSEDGAGGASWQGREIVFMQSNDHSGDRQNLHWDVSGLDGASCEVELVQGDQSSPSWREKLEVVERILCKGAAEHKTLDQQSVSACSIYLNWISCGAIACCEGGGHHRPCRHAESSMRVFRSLEWGLEEASRAGGQNNGSFTSVLIRRLFPLLPSFSSQFRASTPLTRIRDIAHRNDIPQDLKREIKHTIQNKLHRNAGPEDLVATEQMLERITSSDGHQEYSEDFVQEFKRFTVELKEFFNASSMDEQLIDLQGSLGEEERERIADFLKSKHGAASSDSLLTLSHLMSEATGLREVLCRALESGLRNDAPERALEMRQKYRLCEISMENFAFTVASRALNAFGAEDAGAASLDDVMALVVVLEKCVANLSLNGFLQSECRAIAKEYKACAEVMAPLRGSGGEKELRLCMLRLKACLDRTRRVCDAYRDAYLESYSAQANRLGRAFGSAIPDHASAMFAESETRASMIFQCAKVCQILSKHVSRDFLKSENHQWETLVAGEAVGSLEFFETMDDHTMSARGGETEKVLVLKRASGDEEVSASGDGVRGVILMQELPHLSHLAIRARQEGVIFATCTSEEEVTSLLERLQGKQVVFEASQQGVTVTERAPGSTPGGGEQTKSEPSGAVAEDTAEPIEITKSAYLASVGMRGASRETCGAKAAQCGELQRLSQKVAADTGEAYSVPRGVCLPFGCMELVLDMEGARDTWEEALGEIDNLLESKADGKDLDDACEGLRRMIESLTIPADFVQHSVCSHFDPSDVLIARSSANVEDLKGMSGAGLYDSIMHLDASDTRSVGQGIKKVWGSLYTRRAVLSRHKAGISTQAQACMSVLVQEMLDPIFSFVLFTADPITKSRSHLYAEVAPGLGETLASGARGTPYRLRIEKQSSGKFPLSSFLPLSLSLSLSLSDSFFSFSQDLQRWRS